MRKSNSANRNAWRLLLWPIILFLALALMSACGQPSPAAHQDEDHEHEITELAAITLDEGEKLQVVATTNIVGDVVQNVGGEQIELTMLMDTGVDPHTYVPTPADTASIHDAHVVFANGAGLEADLEELLESAGGEAIHIRVSDGIEFLSPPGLPAHEGEDEAGHEHQDVDPHVWFDVQNVIHWVENIEHTLSTLDPANVGTYQQNAQAYLQELEELDAWVEEQIAGIPEANRKFVTNHPAFGYLASRYGLEQVGAVYPISPSAEPSAQDIAALEDAIREFGVSAVFTESTVNPKLAEQVAEDTGIVLVQLYTGSLGEPGSGADTYILLIRYDVNAIVDALK
jgi:ABC-type Zn uptake system ZnuABC Zn-binding protein ZnuA